MVKIYMYAYSGHFHDTVTNAFDFKNKMAVQSKQLTNTVWLWGPRFHLARVVLRVMGSVFVSRIYSDGNLQ